MKNHGNLGVTESYYVSQNIRMIEDKLGHPIPGGMLSMYNLADRFLDPNEVFHIVRNIEMVENKINRKYYPNYSINTSNDSSTSFTSSLITLTIGSVATWIGFDFITNNEVFLGIILGGFGILGIISVIIKIIESFK